MIDTTIPYTMNCILKLPNAEAEAVLYDRLRYLDRTTKLAYSEIGTISLTVQAHRLHEHRYDEELKKPFSFSRWLRKACPWGYSVAFAAMRDVEELKDIPAEHLAEIPQSNFPILRQLSTAVRSTPRVIEAAKTQTAAEFTEQIRKDHPEQHIESRKMLRVNMEESALEKVEEAIFEAMGRGAMSRGEAMEMIAAEALLESATGDGDCEGAGMKQELTTNASSRMRMPGLRTSSCIVRESRACGKGSIRRRVVVRFKATHSSQGW